MSFTKKVNINEKQLKDKLTTLLEKSIDTCDLEFLDKGSTGGVFKVTINSDLDFVLKRISSFDNIIALERDILSPYNLNHPTIFGEIKIDEDPFILMELFNNKGTEWVEDDYYVAIDWLANKDVKLKNHIETIRSIRYISNKNSYLEDLFIERETLFEKNDLYLLGFDVTELISLSRQSIRVLKDEPLTLVHNDYCRNNILIDKKSDVRVIDWVGSYIGSVTLDLAEILNNSPKKLRGSMVNKYKSITNYDVDSLLPYALVNSRLGQVAWRIKRVARGDDKFEDVKDEIQHALVECFKISETNL